MKLYERVPVELRALRQWVVWNYQPNGKEKIKIPLQAHDPSQAAKTNDPTTWAPFETAAIIALKHKLPGPGFVFREGGGLVGVDMDDCIGGDGSIEPWANEWIERFSTYTEISPSGRGVKLWVRASKPNTASEFKIPGATVHTPGHGPMIEVYDRSRFFCVTGKALDGHATISARQDVLDSLYRVFATRNEPPAKLAGGLPPGQRHQALRAFAGSLRARGLGYEEILSALEIFNRQQCSPPKPCAELEALAKYVCQKPTGFSNQRIIETSAEVELQSFDQIAPEDVQWLWRNRVAIGKVHLFVGEPEKGKSLATEDIAARLSRGRDFPDGAPCQAGGTLILTAEDGEADTVRPRLDAANADVSRIYRIKAVKIGLPSGETTETSFSLERDMEKLEEALQKIPPVRLLIIDPLSAYLGTADMWKDSEVRRVLTPLAALAARRRLAVIGIMHLKKGDASALLRVGGSIAFVALSRIVWGFGEHPDDPEMLVMVPVKNNLAQRGDGLAYRIESKDGHGAPSIVWETGSVNIHANDVLAADPRSARKEGNSIAEAKDWLVALLSDGPQSVSGIQQQAETDGLAWRTIQRAKATLSIRTHKVSLAGGWAWELKLPSRARAGGV